MSDNKQSFVFECIVKYTVYTIFVYALCSAVLCLCGFDLYNTNFEDEPFVLISIVIIGFVLYKLPEQFLCNKYIFLIGFLVANLIMLFFLRTVNTMPVSDYYNVHLIAREILHGEYNPRNLPNHSYIYIFNWQIGIVLLESMLLRIYPSIWTFKLLNLVLINLTLFLTYFVAKTLVGEKSARFSFLLMCVFYPMLVTVGQLTNQNIVVPLMLLFVLLIKKNRHFLAGVMLPCISFVRPIGVVLFIAFVCWVSYKWVKRLVNMKTFIRQLMSFVVPCIIVTVTIDMALIKLNYATTPISQSTSPYFKFYQGLFINEWKNPMEKIIEFDEDIDKYNDWVKKELIDAYTQKPVEVTLNNLAKMSMFLGLYDWKFMYTYNQSYIDFTSRMVSKCVAFGWGEYVVLLMLCLIGYRKYFHTQGVDYVQIVFIVMVSVYFFIEAWTDYRYEIYPLMFIFAGCRYSDQV